MSLLGEWPPLLKYDGLQEVWNLGKAGWPLWLAEKFNVFLGIYFILLSYSF